MKVDYVEETSVRKALAFEIEAEVVEQEISARARDYARKAKLPGFRPGKTPTDVIRKRFRGAVLEEAAEALVNKVVFDELEGRGLKPLAPPKIADLKIEDGQAMTFRAVFETLPFVELPDYHGLPVKVKAAAVSDEALGQELERLREGAARYEPVDGRPLAQGDFALLDLSWRPAGGGKPQRDENAMIEVGNEGNHPLLNQTLVGMAVGERKQVRIDYPAEHPSSRLAGKSFDYTLLAKGIKRKVLPALDDELAKDLGEFDTLAALREDLRRHLEAAEQRRVQRDVRSGLLAALAQRASFEVPEALVERHMSARTEGAARSLAVQGLDPGRLGVDWRQYREAQREESVQAAKADILLAEIARREGIEVSRAELDAEVVRLAERARSSPEAMRARLEKEGDLDALRARIHEDKTLDLLKADARLEFE